MYIYLVGEPLFNKIKPKMEQSAADQGQAYDTFYHVSTQLKKRSTWKKTCVLMMLLTGMPKLFLFLNFFEPGDSFVDKKMTLHLKQLMNDFQAES